MLTSAKARKVTIYLNEDTSSANGFAYEQVLRFLYEQEVVTATLVKLEEGFGSHHQPHALTRRHLPVRVDFIDSVEVVEALLPALMDLVPDGLIEMQDTTIVKAAKREAVF